MAEIPQGHVVHKTRRRVRVKIPSKRHNGHFFAKAMQELSQKMPQAQMEANPATASILIRCADTMTLLSALGGGGPFEIATPHEDSGANFERVRQELKDLNDKFRRWTGGANDARTYIFLALLLSAAYQIARGEIFAPAATLLWYAGEALRVWAPQAKVSSEGSSEAKLQVS